MMGQASYWMVVVAVMCAMTAPALGEEPADRMGPEEHRKGEIGGPTPEAQRRPPDWHYGGFVDLGYSLDFNFPQNHLFRNRSTTPRVNELDLNMAGIYVKKDATEQSRWGMELMGQAGQDARNFGFGTDRKSVV